MKSLFSLLMVLGLIFQPALLSAAEEAATAPAKKATDAAAPTEKKAGAADENLEDWELGADDLSAQDEDDAALDEEDGAAAKDAAKAPAETTEKKAQE